MRGVTGISTLKERIGRYGVWRSGRVFDVSFAVEADRLGFGALWVGGQRGAGLEQPTQALEATAEIVVGTGIVNIWTVDPRELAASYRRVAAAHPDRFVLGVGVGHPENVGEQARRPYAALVEFVEVLLGEGVPREALVLAALGPRVLRLAAERTAGAHPYLVTPAHTRHARDVLGPEPLLVPEQRVVLDADPSSARDLARPGIVTPYLGLVNYRNNLLRLGYTPEQLDTADDALVDDLVVSGTPDQVAAGLAAHLEAGADQVAVQLVVADEMQAVPALRRLADVLELTPRT